MGLVGQQESPLLVVSQGFLEHVHHKLKGVVIVVFENDVVRRDPATFGFFLLPGLGRDHRFRKSRINAHRQTPWQQKDVFTYFSFGKKGKPRHYWMAGESGACATGETTAFLRSLTLSARQRPSFTRAN